MRDMSVSIPASGNPRTRISSADIAGYGMKGEGGAGTPSAYCKSCTIRTQGIGLLKRCEIELKAYTRGQFVTMYSDLVRLGSEFEVNWGNSNGSVSGTFRTYDFSFEIDRLGGYDVTVKGLSKGEGPGRLYDEVDVLQQKFPNGGLEYVSNYLDINEKSKVQNAFDYVYYMCQEFGDILDAVGAGPKTTNDEKGYAKRVTKNKGGVAFDCILAEMPYLPKDTPGLIHPGKVTDDDSTPVYYVTLGTLVQIVQVFCIQPLGVDYELTDDITYCEIDYFNELIPSDPKAVCWRFPGGQNNGAYGEDNSETEMDVDTFHLPSDAMKLYFNMIYISEIVEATRQTTNEDSTVEAEDREYGTLPMKKFFDQLFGVLRQNSGGWIDLTLDIPEGEKKIYVVNKNSQTDISKPSGLKIDVPWLDTSTSPPTPKVTPGIRDLGISGAVPSSMTAKYFGEAPDTLGVAHAAKAGGADIEATEPESVSSSEIKDELIKIGRSGFEQGVGGGLRQLVNRAAGIHAKDKAKFDPPPIPLDVTLVTNGCVGWTFGGLLEIGGLPSVLTGGAELAWTCTEYMQKAEGVDWTSEAKFVPRILP